MNKPNVKKLKYPIWFTVVFYCLTVIFPVVLIMIEGFTSPSKAFRITFGVICALVILWTFLHKFILVDYEKKLKEKSTQLEHEYEIEVGNSKSIKWLWYTNEQKLSILNSIQVLVIGALMIIIATGVAEGFMSIKAISLGISILYGLAYLFKFITVSVLKGSDVEGE